ncbi:MAG: hypothetical protein CUN54_07100 [Phototrophicales bacterium]|nr:MAG: hypothetical protein CUN54_07100 [Phototrophicales bacterium]
MTIARPPTLPEEIPAAPRPSKYMRPRRYFSWPAVVIGLIMGLAGGLFYAWNVNPISEVDTAPWQLRQEDKNHYVVAIALSFAHDGDLNRVQERLLQLRLNTDPIQYVADVACDLASGGYVDSSSGLSAIRSMMVFYQLQGRSGCADTLIELDTDEPETQVLVLPTPTLAPPASKTPTPIRNDRATATPSTLVIVPTSPPQRDFVLVSVNTFCDSELTGLIEAYVQDFNGDGIPGQPVRVRWDEGDDTFFTGLKPERGPAYADFEMEEGKGYTVEMPGLSDPTTQPLVAVPCTTDDGEQALTSYRVVFRPVN